jgi:hypothetical protein
MDNMVVFPQPDGPIKLTNSPSLISAEKFLMTTWSPSFLLGKTLWAL